MPSQGQSFSWWCCLGQPSNSQRSLTWESSSSLGILVLEWWFQEGRGITGAQGVVIRSTKGWGCTTAYTEAELERVAQHTVRWLHASGQSHLAPTPQLLCL